MNTISRSELKRRMDAGEAPILVETLPKRYFDTEHLPGAINIPHDEIRHRASSELPDKNAIIVVYCASIECQNSRIAAQTLRVLGYGHVLEYVGGKQDWKEAGYQLQGKSA